MYQMKMLSHIWGQTNQPVTDQLLELLEWLFATKNVICHKSQVWSTETVTKEDDVHIIYPNRAMLSARELRPDQQRKP